MADVAAGLEAAEQPVGGALRQPGQLRHLAHAHRRVGPGEGLEHVEGPVDGLDGARGANARVRGLCSSVHVRHL